MHTEKKTHLQIRITNAFFSKRQVSLQSSFREKQDNLEGEKILGGQQKYINFYCNILYSLLNLLSRKCYHLMDSAFSRAIYSSYSY